MNYRQFFNQVTRQVAITKRLSSVAVIYIIFWRWCIGSDEYNLVVVGQIRWSRIPIPCIVWLIYALSPGLTHYQIFYNLKKC